MKKMKKYILQLGVLASVAAPVAAVISCGSKSSTSSKVNLSAEISKFKDNYSSSKNAATLTTDVGSLIAGAAVTGEQLGIDVPTLSTGVKATFSVNTVFNTSAKTMLVNVTLTKDGVSVGNLENNAKSDILIKASDHVETTGDDVTITPEMDAWFKAGIIKDLKDTSDADLDLDKVIEIFKKYGVTILKDRGSTPRTVTLGNKHGDFDTLITNWKALKDEAKDKTIKEFATFFKDASEFDLDIAFVKAMELAYKEKDKSSDQKSVDAAKRAFDKLIIKAKTTTVTAVTTATPLTESVLTAIGSYVGYKAAYPDAAIVDGLTLTYTVAEIAANSKGNMTINISKGNAKATATIVIQTSEAVTQEQINLSKDFKSFWTDFGKKLNAMAAATPDGSTVLKWMRSTKVNNGVESQEPSAYVVEKTTGDLDAVIVDWLEKFGFNYTPDNWSELTAGDPLPAKLTGIKKTNMGIGYYDKGKSKFILYQDPKDAKREFDTAKLAIDAFMAADGFYSKTTTEGTLKEYLVSIMPVYQYWANIYKITEDMTAANTIVASALTTDAQMETFLGTADATTAIALANKYVPGGNDGNTNADSQIGTVVLESDEFTSGSGSFFASVKINKGAGKILKNENGVFSMVAVNAETKINQDYMLSLGLEFYKSKFSPKGLTDKGNWLVDTVEKIAFVQQISNARSKSLGYMFIKIKGQSKWWLASDYARYLQFKAKDASEQTEDDAKKLSNALSEVGKSDDYFQEKEETFKLTDWTTGTHKDLYDYVKSTIVPEATTA